MNLFYTDPKKAFFPFVLVVMQFSCIFYILLTAKFYPSGWLVLIYFLGIFLGFWAIYTMRDARLNVTPDVVPGTKIISRGPYKIIRHPMYLAIFLTLLPLVIQYYSLNRLFVFFLLIVNQIVKISYEEIKLNKSFEDYKIYQKKTWKLIPFVF